MYRYLILWGLCWASGLMAQPGSWGLSLDYAQGVTLRHRQDMVFALPRPARGWQVEALRQTDGRRYAEATLRRFRWGLGASWLDYGGHRDELGYAWSVYPFFDLPLLRSPRLSLWGRMSMGLAYVDRRFHRLHNPGNNAIGSPLNAHVAITLLAEARLSPRWSLRVAGDFAHQSNAKRVLPNLGLNTARLRGGLTYRWHIDDPVVPMRLDSLPPDRRLRLGLRYGFGLTERGMPDGPGYPVHVATAFVARRISRANRLFTGFEYSYRAEIHAFMQDNDLGEEEQGWYPQRLAWVLGYELGCGHFGMTGQYLLYLQGLPEGRLAGWGSKFGPQIYLRNQRLHPHRNLFLGVYLLTHLAVAQYFEVSVGAVF